MAEKKSLLWHVFFSYLLVLLVSLVAVTWLASNSMRHFFLDKTRVDLQTRALLFETTSWSTWTHSMSRALTGYARKSGLLRSQGLP